MKKLSYLFTAIVLIVSIQSNAQNVGIGQAMPISKLDINGNLVVGTGYSGTVAAPANGAIIEGNVGAPQAPTDCK